MSTYFFTGFPGFIASALLRQLLLSNRPVERVYLLVLPSFVSKAEEVATQIAAETGISKDVLQVIAGDITKERLGLNEEILRQLQAEVHYVYHLAAIYDLAVAKELAYQVNVVGTNHVNDWVRMLSHLKRYVYFSTAYVSGDRQGRILETELEMGQGFKNHYESTKYEAEVLVRSLLPSVPITIIRPGIVKGDSKTGATIKFDGPYMMLNLFDRLKFLPLIPYLGGGHAMANFVSVDYILAATLYLGHAEVGIGKTYHLCDKQTYTMHEVYAMLMEELLHRKPTGRVPLAPMRWLMSISLLRKWLRVEKEALDYFSYELIYDSTHAQQDLQGSDIHIPDFKESAPAMVRFYREHKNDPSKHISIR